MKKHALLITAYKNYDYLESSIELLKTDFDIYIHVDKSSKEIGLPQIKGLENKGCMVISKYEICWGGINHLYAIIDLLQCASQNSYLYYHIISGEDLLVKTYSEIETFFTNNRKIYISLHDATNSKLWNVRYRFYYLFVNKDYRIAPYRQINKLLLMIQKMFRINRKKIGNEINVYKGYVYGSLPHDAVEYVLDYIKKYPIFLKDLKYCLIPEEFFFQTILGNSHMKARITDDCKRYSLWEYKHGSIPGYLDETDIEEISLGDYLFARKVNYEFSGNLISEFNERHDKENKKG